ncbi:hypothetical protein MDAP_000077 [Mitosporidium daphniae]
MNLSRLKYLLVFVLSTFLTSASFASDTYRFNDVLNEFELFILVGLLSIHTLPILPSKQLYSKQEDFFRFEFGSELQRSAAVSSFYLGGTIGSSIGIFVALKWSIQVYTYFCSILLVIGHLFFTFSTNWIFLAVGRFCLGMALTR